MKITTVGIDLAKNVFQVHAVDERGAVVLRKQTVAIDRNWPRPCENAVAAVQDGVGGLLRHSDVHRASSALRRATCRFAATGAPMPDRNGHKKALTRLPISSPSSSGQCRALASLA